MSYLRVEFHVFHPSPSPESGKGFLAAGFLLRRNRAIRLLPVRDFCSGAYMGPKFSAKERKKINLSRFYSISQIEYCPNFIFKKNFPIHKLFERSCELGLWRLTAHKIAEIFG